MQACTGTINQHMIDFSFVSLLFAAAVYTIYTLDYPIPGFLAGKCVNLYWCNVLMQVTWHTDNIPTAVHGIQECKGSIGLSADHSGNRAFTLQVFYRTILQEAQILLCHKYPNRYWLPLYKHHWYSLIYPVFVHWLQTWNRYMAAEKVK